MPAQPLLEDAREASVPAIAIRIPVRLIGAILLALVAVVMPGPGGLPVRVLPLGRRAQ